jgi:hypothetical protein
VPKQDASTAGIVENYRPSRRRYVLKRCRLRFLVDRRRRWGRQPSLTLASAGRGVEFPMNDSRLGDEHGALRWDVERRLNDELARVG